MAKFRILSLDGGGSWALLQVMALQAVYSDTAKGHDILKDFDLVAATSGGSITLGGLIENQPLNALLNDYFLNETKRRTVFSPVSFAEDIGNAFFKPFHLAPRYATSAKFTALQALLPNFGGVKLSRIPGRIVSSTGKSPHIVIFAFDYDRKRVKPFRSNLKSDAASTAAPLDVTLVQAIHASSTAPVKFFDHPAVIDGMRFWDGAIAGYNNPVLGAVVEALANRVLRDDVQVLSIGTGSVRLPIDTEDNDTSGLKQRREWSTIPYDLQVLAGSIIDDPPDAATFIAHVALGRSVPDSNQTTVVDSGSLVRMSPMVQPILNQSHNWSLPPGLTALEFADLKELEMDAVAQLDVLKIQKLGSEWLADRVPNQPIRSSSETFACEIGHDKFSQAKKAWMDLRQT